MQSNKSYAEGRRDGVCVALRVILMSRPGDREVQRYMRTLCTAIINGEPDREEIVSQLRKDKLWPTA